MTSETKKRLLWLDDDPYPFQPIVNEVKKHYDVVQALRLIDAVQSVKNTKPPFDGYIVDLDLPVRDAPVELQKFLDELEPSPLNAGQAFTRWLWQKHHPDAQVMYFTQVKDYFDTAFEAKSQNGKLTAQVLTKSDSAASIGNIIKTLEPIFA